jgi:TIR domain
MPDAMHTIFFSYARSDAPFVLKVANGLRAERRRVWVDQLDIAKGARWDEEVENALKSCSCLMVVLSPTSVKSQNVLDEVSYALDEKRTVLPILLQAVSIPFRLKRLQYIDFTGDFDAAYGQLLAALDALPAPQAPSTTEEPAPAPMVKPPEAAAEVRGVEAPPQRPPEREAVGEGPTVGAPRRFPTGIVAAVAVVFVLGASYLFFAFMKTPPPEPEPRTVRAPVERSEQPAEGPRQRPEAGATSPVEVARNPAAPGAPALSDARVKTFVDEYIAAQNRANAAGLLRFYADQVDYFDQKGVGRDFILKDKQSYYRRWPEVENRLASELKVDRSLGDGSALVTYTIQWRANSPARGATASGAARDELMLRLAKGELSIVAQRQHVLGAVN